MFHGKRLIQKMEMVTDNKQVEQSLTGCRRRERDQKILVCFYIM